MDRELTTAYRFAHAHGSVALIAVVSIGFMAWLWMTTVEAERICMGIITL